MHSVTVSSPKSGHKDVTFQIELGSSLQDAVAKFGEEIVWNKWVTQCSTDAGNMARAALNSHEKKDGTKVPGDDPEVVVADMLKWKPGMRQAADPVAAIAKKLEGKTPEEKNALIQALLAKLNA